MPFKPSEWKKQGLPIIRIQNLNDSTAEFNYFDGAVGSDHQVKAGDLLFAWSGTKSLEQLIAKKRLLKQGVMQELLSGRRRLPGFGLPWDAKYIGQVLTILHGKGQQEVAASNGAYPILASGGEIGRATRFLYDRPSVLIGRKGTINQPKFIDTPFWAVDTLFFSAITEPNIAKYLYYQFLLIDWNRYSEASGVPSLNARTIEQIELMVPQPDEQVAIAAVLSDMDAEIEALEAKLTKARHLKQGMAQQLLTGKIRLI